MAWISTLQLDYSRAQEQVAPSDSANGHARTRVHSVHAGPLRVLKSLYPEGPAICHNVLVHPPGGLTGGDTLNIDVRVASGAHGLITTPSATRFYRTDGETALQDAQLFLAEGARLEWLPLESIAYSGCRAHNRLHMALEPGAELMGWDVTALGLPHANLPFTRGSFCQHIALAGAWLERGQVDAGDLRLMMGPQGLAGYTCFASLFFAAGNALPRARRALALDAARAAIALHPLAATAGVTSPNPQVVVARVLAAQVEPVMQLLQAVRAAWRCELWDLPGTSPRIWAM